MKILMVSDDFSPAATGVGTHLKVVVPLLVKRGHQISIITSRRKGEPEREQIGDATIYRAPTVKMFGFYQALPTKKLIEQILDTEQIEIVHYHYLSIMLKRAFAVANQRSLAHIYTYHMTVDHLTQPWPMHPFRPLLSRLIVKYCNRFGRIMVPSASLTEQVKATGISVPTFYVSNPVSFTGRETSTVTDPSVFKVFFAGRLNPEKNVPFLLNAFAEFAAGATTEVQLRIAGTGSSLKAYARLSERLGISHRVQFLGFLDSSSMATEYAGCNVFVLPSLIETQGLVAMEAMRFGKPVIVADSVISAAELVDDGVNGYIVKANDVASLAARLRELKSNPDLCTQFGESGRARADLYSPRAIVKQIETHYEALIA